MALHMKIGHILCVTILGVALLSYVIYVTETSVGPARYVKNGQYRINVSFSSSTLSPAKTRIGYRTMTADIRKNEAPKRTVKCLTGVVTIPASGRLGNCIMEYASVLAVAARFNMTPLVPSSMLDTLSEVFAHLTSESLAQYISKRCPPWMTEEGVVSTRFPDSKKLDQWPEIARKAGRPIVLRNQSREIPLMIPMLNKIRTELTLKKKLVENAQQKLHYVKQLLGTENVAFVGIHVRRRDYNEYLKEKFNVDYVGVDYYRRAAMLMLKRLLPKTVAFIVVSDDPNWCRKILLPELPNSFFLGDSDISFPGDDFALLTACNHSIISYGTFASWSALLAGGMTLAYRLPNGLINTPTIISKYLPFWELIS